MNRELFAQIPNVFTPNLTKKINARNTVGILRIKHGFGSCHGNCFRPNSELQNCHLHWPNFAVSVILTKKREEVKNATFKIRLFLRILCHNYRRKMR